MTNKEGKEALTAARSNKIRDEIIQIMGEFGHVPNGVVYALLHYFEDELVPEKLSEVAESRKANETFNKCKEMFESDQAGYKAIDKENPHSYAFVAGYYHTMLKTLFDSGEIVPPENEWISVKDHLPEINEPVIAFIKWQSGKPVVAVIKRVKEDDCEWRTVDDNSELSYYLDVTHWMPLPDTSKLKVKH